MTFYSHKKGAVMFYLSTTNEAGLIDKVSMKTSRFGIYCGVQSMITFRTTCLLSLL
jgi:hypothetical protein